MAGEHNVAGCGQAVVLRHPAGLRVVGQGRRGLGRIERGHGQPAALQECRLGRLARQCRIVRGVVAVTGVGAAIAVGEHDQAIAIQDEVAPGIDEFVGDLIVGPVQAAPRIVDDRAHRAGPGGGFGDLQVQRPEELAIASSRLHFVALAGPVVLRSLVGDDPRRDDAGALGHAARPVADGLARGQRSHGRAVPHLVIDTGVDPGHVGEIGDDPPGQGWMVAVDAGIQQADDDAGPRVAAAGDHVLGIDQRQMRIYGGLNVRRRRRSTTTASTTASATTDDQGRDILGIAATTAGRQTQAQDRNDSQGQSLAPMQCVHSFSPKLIARRPRQALL